MRNNYIVPYHKNDVSWPKIKRKIFEKKKKLTKPKCIVRFKSDSTQIHDLSNLLFISC